jgi:hypothetical protein
VLKSLLQKVLSKPLTPSGITSRNISKTKSISCEITGNNQLNNCSFLADIIRCEKYPLKGEKMSFRPKQTTFAIEQKRNELQRQSERYNEYELRTYPFSDSDIS